MPKGHPLTNHLNDLFLQSFEAGLHMRWNLEWSFLGKKIDYQKTRYVVKPMTVKDIEIALYALAFGLFFAAIVFVAEILTKMFWKL